MGIIRPATPGFLVTLTATILLLVVSFSVPWFKSVYFLKASVNSHNQSGFVTFGTLGYCTSLNNAAPNCTAAHIGYQFNPNQLLGDNIKFLQIPSIVTKWITYCLFLHVIAFGLAAVAALFGLLAHVREMAMTCFSSCISGFAASVALIAFIFDLVLFFTAKAEINKVAGGQATIGIAIWLTLAAWVLLFFSGCFYGIGRCCVSRRPKGNSPSKEGGWFSSSGANGQDNSKTSYAEMMRLDAVKAEADRKARQAAGERGLPAFPSVEENKPLQSHYEATYAEEDEEGHDHSYRDLAGTAGLAGVGVGAAAAARTRGPRSPPPRHPTSPSQYSPTREHSPYQPYGVAAASTGYTPAQPGSRTIDAYNNTQPSADSAYPQRQPSSGQNQGQYNSGGFRGQQPSSGYHDAYASGGDRDYYAAAAGVAGGAYAAHQHDQNQRDEAGYGQPAHAYNQYGNQDQYLGPGHAYGHTQDTTAYHTANDYSQYEHGRDESAYAYNNVGHNQDPSTYPSNPGNRQSANLPNPHEGAELPVPGGYEASAYPSSNALPVSGSNSNGATPYYTPQSQQPNRAPSAGYPGGHAENYGQHQLSASPAPIHRPESSATSYFPYGSQETASQPRQYAPYGQQLASPGGLRVVQERSGSLPSEPPEYSQGSHAYQASPSGGWARKS